MNHSKQLFSLLKSNRNPMMKYELAHLVLTKEELEQIDYALPLKFVEDCSNLLNMDPRPFMVWIYDREAPIGGRPLNLAERFYQIYENAQNLWDNAQALLIDAQDRGDCYDDDGEMHRDYLRVAHSLDQITLDKREIFGEKLKTEG